MILTIGDAMTTMMMLLLMMLKGGSRVARPPWHRCHRVKSEIMVEKKSSSEWDIRVNLNFLFIAIYLGYELLLISGGQEIAQNK